MSSAFRARLVKLELAPIFQENITFMSEVSAVLALQLSKIMNEGEESKDWHAAAEILKYGPSSAATFAELSSQALCLAERLLEAEYERVCRS